MKAFNAPYGEHFGIIFAKREDAERFLASPRTEKPSVLEEIETNGDVELENGLADVESFRAWETRYYGEQPTVG